MRIFLIFGALVALTTAYPLTSPNTDPEAQKIVEDFLFTSFRYFLQGNLTFLDNDFYLMDNEGNKATKYQLEIAFGPQLTILREKYENDEEFRKQVDELLNQKRDGDWSNCVIQFINNRFIEVKMIKDNLLVGYIILKPNDNFEGGYKLHRLVIVGELQTD
ncbi:unnamed protein product [Caenorhabditis angaria]|uniref:DUF38 domain-containing protein n=1 Tax=Caenorhabditis angaria TaxID=860376 RepID=A0A9P1IEC5_9PELO|nr:unnamed protein product [Caenorhabditis angaria]